MNLTDLDRAHDAMEADPADDRLRLRFFERLADSELFLLLSEEADGDSITPELFNVGDQHYVLVFDTADRLAEFVGKVAPFAATSGRGLCALLEGQGAGLALNPDVAPSAMLIPADAVDWLARTLAEGPEETSAQISEVGAPQDVPQELLLGLDRKLATAGGLARAAYLVSVSYKDGGRGRMLAFVDAVEEAEPALASAVGEALTFSGIEAGALDVSFIRAQDPIAASLAKWGLRFDLPEPAQVETNAPKAPGMDPDSPPKLR